MRSRPKVEENCSADLSHSVRGESSEVDLSSDASLTCGEVCGEAEFERPTLLPARGPTCLSWFPFPRPSRWAWNVEVCCSRELKFSWTLSNCRDRDVFSTRGCLVVFKHVFLQSSVLKVPAQCWTEAEALARLTHCCCAPCCWYECDSRLTPEERDRAVSQWGEQQNIRGFTAWAELHLQ